MDKNIIKTKKKNTGSPSTTNTNKFQSKNLKSHKKKPLSIITSPILTIDTNINTNSNTISTSVNNTHKRAISHNNSSQNNTNENKNRPSTALNFKVNKNSNSNNKSKIKSKSKEVNLNLNINSNRSPSSNNNNKMKNKKIQKKNSNNNLSEKGLRTSFHSPGQNLIKEKFNNNVSNNNHFLITTFINLSKNSKSKSPLNTTNNKQSNIKNNNNKDLKKQKNTITKHNTSHNIFKPNSNVIHSQKRIIKSRENSVSNSNSKILKNTQSGSNILLTVNSTKNDFVCCSTNFQIEEIKNKLNLLCDDKNYKFKFIDNTHFYISNQSNSISIEISNVSGKNVMKMFHMCGNEKLTKEIIKNIIVEIGF